VHFASCRPHLSSRLSPRHFAFRQIAMHYFAVHSSPARLPCEILTPKTSRIARSLGNRGVYTTGLTLAKHTRGASTSRKLKDVTKSSLDFECVVCKLGFMKNHAVYNLVARAGHYVASWQSVPVGAVAIGAPKLVSTELHAARESDRLR
jgi:hypothetical protein